MADTRTTVQTEQHNRIDGRLGILFMFTQECPHCHYKLTTYVDEPAVRALMDEHILDRHPEKIHLVAQLQRRSDSGRFSLSSQLWHCAVSVT